MSEVENATPEPGSAEETFTPDERAYFDSRGEKELPFEPTEESKAAPPEGAPDVEEKPAADAAKPDAPAEKRMVDYGALAEERARRKALEEKVREHEIMQARWEERFRAAQPPQQPQKPPSPDEDIFGAVKYQGQILQQTQQELAAQRQREAQAAQMQQIGSWAVAQEAEFKATTPDYDDALKHLRANRVAELKVWGMNDFQINQQMIMEERQLLMQSAQTRTNPAERAYNLAKARGYNPNTPKHGLIGKTEVEPDKLDVIEHGQQASKSLSAVGGKAGGGVEITAMDVLKMPADEFEAWKNKNPAKFRRIMGAAH